MVQVADLAGVPEAKGVVRGDVTIMTDGCGFSVRADRLAWDSYETLAVAGGRPCMLALSATGGSTEVRSFRAAMGVTHKVTFRYIAQGTSSSTFFDADEDGYEIHIKNLGMRKYHMVAIAKRRGFLLTSTEAALWEYLRKETTTPMDRRWLPAIARELLRRGHIYKVKSDGDLSPAIVRVTDEQADDVVKFLLSKKLIKIEVENG